MKSNKKTPRELTFVKLERILLTSPAYQYLSDKARLGLINVMHNWYGPNHKEFTCPFSRLINKMAPATWSRVQDELVEHGFVALTHQSKGLVNSANKFRLVNEWRRFGTPEFKKPKIRRATNPNNNFAKLWESNKKGMIKKRRDRKNKP